MQYVFDVCHLHHVPTLTITADDANEMYTGYIDFIKPSMMTAECMQGYDWLGRRFISFKYTCCKYFECEDTGLIRCTKPKVLVMTLFERYTDSSSCLCVGGKLVFWHQSYMNDLPTFIHQFKKLIQGEFVYLNSQLVVFMPLTQQQLFKALTSSIHPHLVQLIKPFLWGRFVFSG